MRAAVAIPILLVSSTVVAFAAASGAVWLAMKSGAQFGNYLSIAFLIAAAFTSAVWLAVRHLLLKPISNLARELRLHAQTRLDRPLAPAVGHLLDGLTPAAERVVAALTIARGETEEAVSAATRRMQEQKSRLEAILLDLSEGVIVANLEHRILLYNQAAVQILGMGDALGLARSLFGVVARDPVVLTLDLLLDRNQASGTDASSGNGKMAQQVAIRPFLCATADQHTLLRARLSLVVEPSTRPSGYVLTFAEIENELQGVIERDGLLREVTVEWRRPLASLRAAAEMLTGQPQLELVDRRVFEEIIGKEVMAINDCFADLALRYERLASAPWPLADIHSPDLFRAVVRQLGSVGGIELTLVGVPAWVSADSHSLVLALKHLIICLANYVGTRAFDIGAVRRGDFVYIEIAWKGGLHLTSTVIDSWLDEPLRGTIGNRTVRQIVERHSSEVWSQPLPEGRNSLRLPLRAAVRPKARERPDRLVPMPELYDFDLFEVSREAIKELPLRRLDMVVFDTETTGLRPNERDAILSIGAVRVVNGRILTGETFERLVNPGRDIPATSTEIHGITAEKVRDKPPIDVVLPQFKTFVGDSVLVAYNAAFDMRFLEVAATGSDISFTNPVLDVLFLASYLHQDETDYSLSATAHRLGVEVIGRHTALGDAMTTAAILVKLIDLLQERGIDTLGKAARISSRMMELQRQQAKLA